MTPIEASEYCLQAGCVACGIAVQLFSLLKQPFAPPAGRREKEGGRVGLDHRIVQSTGVSAMCRGISCLVWVEIDGDGKGCVAVIAQAAQTVVYWNPLKGDFFSSPWETSCTGSSHLDDSGAKSWQIILHRVCSLPWDLANPIQEPVRWAGGSCVPMFVAFPLAAGG